MFVEHSADRLGVRPQPQTSCDNLSATANELQRVAVLTIQGFTCSSGAAFRFECELQPLDLRVREGHRTELGGQPATRHSVNLQERDRDRALDFRIDG